MTGYDGTEFLRLVREHWAPRERRTRPTGCWVCDDLLPYVWIEGVASMRRERDRCATISGGVVDAHHLVSRQQLKKEIRWRHDVSEDVLLDPRNGILVRRFHHDALEGRRLAIPKALWPVEALDFARELGLEWWIDNMEARRA